MNPLPIFAPGTSLASQKPLKLDFSGTSRDGLEVTARRVPMSAMTDAAAVAEALGRALVSWNVKDEDGKPVPATPAALASRDPEFTADVGWAWCKAVAREWTPVPSVPVKPGVRKQEAPSQ